MHKSLAFLKFIKYFTVFMMKCSRFCNEFDTNARWHYSLSDVVHLHLVVNLSFRNFSWILHFVSFYFVFWLYMYIIVDVLKFPVANDTDKIEMNILQASDRLNGFPLKRLLTRIRIWTLGCQGITTNLEAILSYQFFQPMLAEAGQYNTYNFCKIWMAFLLLPGKQ